jgi:hypothetical protein
VPELEVALISVHIEEIQITKTKAQVSTHRTVTEVTFLAVITSLAQASSTSLASTYPTDQTSM